jgi:hypothetical protein
MDQWESFDLKQEAGDGEIETRAGFLQTPRTTPIRELNAPINEGRLRFEDSLETNSTSEGMSWEPLHLHLHNLSYATGMFWQAVRSTLIGMWCCWTNGDTDGPAARLVVSPESSQYGASFAMSVRREWS